VEGGRPEVHAQRLLLVHVSHRGVVGGDVANLVTIDGPADVIRRPLHGVGVPVVARVEPMRVLVRLVLLMAVAVNDVHREGVALNRRHNLYVQLIPLAGLEVRAVPIREEGADRSHFVWGLHAGDELAVGEFLVRGDRATAVSRLSNTNDSYDRACEFGHSHSV